MASDSDAAQDVFIDSVCIFRVYFGICKNQDECRFSHSLKAIASTSPSPAASAPQTPNPFQPRRNPKSGNGRKGSQRTPAHRKTPKNNDQGGKGEGDQPTNINGSTATPPGIVINTEEANILRTNMTITLGEMCNSDDPPLPKSPPMRHEDSSPSPFEHPPANPEDQAHNEGHYPNDSPNDGHGQDDPDADEPLQPDAEHRSGFTSSDDSAFGVDSGLGEGGRLEESGKEVEEGREEDIVAGEEEESGDVNTNNRWQQPLESNNPPDPRVSSAPHTSSSVAGQQPTPSRAPQVSLLSLHWSQFADPNSDRQLPFCKAFAQNKCSNVDACKFRHCLTVQEFGQLFKDQQPLQITLDKRSIRNDSPADSTVITSPSVTLHWSHYADPTCDASVAFCKQYAQNVCPSGNDCSFRHCLAVREYTLLFKDPQPNTIAASGGLVPTSSTAPLLDPTGHNAHSPTPPSSLVSRPTPCSFFRKGTCRNGDQCSFYHSKDCPNLIIRGFCSETNCAKCNQVEQKPGPPKRVCQYWPKGNCRNGEACPFSHEGGSETGVRVNEPEPKPEPEPEPENDNKVEGPPGANDWWQDSCNNGWGPSNDASAWEQPNDGAFAGGQANDDKNNNGLGQTSGNARGSNNGTKANNDRNYANNNSDGWNQPSSRPSKICRNFQRDGRCSRGSDCHYSHGVSSGTDSRGSRDHSRSRGRPARAGAGSSRGTLDPKSVEQWGRDVAESQVQGESQVGGGDDNRSRSRNGQQRGTQRGARNRSVDPASNGSCQFYLAGLCSNGDTCPLSHDAAAGGSELLHNEEQEEEPDHAVRDDFDRSGTEEDLDRKDQERALREDKIDECTRDTVEEIVPDDTNDQHCVLESNLDDQWESRPPEWPGEGTRIDKPCLRYGQGFCPLGDECLFLHIDPDESSTETSIKEEVLQAVPEEEPEGEASEKDTQEDLLQTDVDSDAEANDYGHPLVEKSIFGCAVIFDRDCLPEKVTTATDSHVLLLEASPGITEARVHDVVNKYGAVEDIIITARDEPELADEAGEGGGAPSSMISVRVEFKEMRDAARAARSLRLPLADALAIEEAAPVSTWIKFRWPQPARAAWVHYPTITKAKMMAEKLQGITFQERKITATFLRPDKRQKELFAVKLEKLPPSATRENLAEAITEATVINVSELTYTDKPQDILRELDSVKEFVEVPEDVTKINAIAFARFSSQETIQGALKMNGKKQQFLGKQELVVERVWFARYILPNVAFKVVASEVKALHVQCEGRVHVEFSDHGDFAVVYVYAILEEREAFAAANLSLQTICRGTVVTTDSRPEWDDYFYSTSSAKVIENLNSKNQFYIFPDIQTREIHVLGSGLDLGRGVSTIKKLLQKVRESCQEHTIHRNTLQELVNGGLSKLQGDVGTNKLFVDILRSILIVRGSDAALMQKIRPILDYTPPSQNHDEPNCSGPLCSICELQPGGGSSTPAVELSCGHVYCMACLQHALISAAHGSSAPVKCIGRVPAEDRSDLVTCGQPIAYTVVRDLLPLAEEPKYLAATFTSLVLSNPDEYFFCPAFRCEAVYRQGDPGDTLRCPVCRSWNCLHCGSFSHDGINCDEAAQARKNVRA